MSDTTTASEPVTYEQLGDVAVIRIDDGKANAMSHAIVDGINTAFAQACRDAKAVAIVGRDGKFSAGFDLTTMKAGPKQARDLLKAGAEMGHALYVAPIPVVIGCTGHALAMGAIALFCADVRIGAEGAYKIGMNEVAIGMPVPRFAIELARERLTPRQLSAAVNLAQVYDPATAVEAGYLDRVVALADVEAEAITAATSLAATLQPAAFRLTREYLRGDSAARVTEGLRQDIETFAIVD
jgi:enoyl-CoA hydratase